MQQGHSTPAGDGLPQGCWHIGRWNAAGTFFTIALKRCYKSRTTASTTMNNGMIGDRSWYGDHLDASQVRKILRPSAESGGKTQSVGNSNRLQVVRCNPQHCDCHRWRTGHRWTPSNPAPEPELKRQLKCEDCDKGRRRVVEVTDPKDEIPRLYCRRCAERRVLEITFKGRRPLLRWRHADEPTMTFLTVWG